MHRLRRAPPTAPVVARPKQDREMRVPALVVGLAIAGAVVPVGVGAQSLGFLSQWGSYGAGSGQFNTPVGITTDRTGLVYVTDYGNARVEVFTGDGAYLAQWTTLDHGFSTPTGIAVGPSGDVYVSEHTMNRMQVLTQD